MSNSRLELIFSAGTVDLTGGEPIALNFSVAGIQDISKRNSNYSQTFTVPGTRANNQLFNFIFEIGSDSQYPINKKVPAYILEDSIPVISGNVQLTGIKVTDRKEIMYEIILYGESDDLITTLGTNLLTDLTGLSAYTHTYNQTTIEQSWTGNTSLGYYYPMIDYGYGWSYNSLNGTTNYGVGAQTSNFFPAIYAKTYLDLIFSAANYTYSSTFINGPDFERYMVPFCENINVGQPLSFATGRTFLARMHSQITGSTSGGTVLPVMTIPFNDVSTSPNFDHGNLFSITGFTYSSDTYSSQSFGVSLDYALSGTNLFGNIEVYKNGTNTSSNIIGQFPFIQLQANNGRHQISFQTPNVSLIPGDKVFAQLTVGVNNVYAGQMSFTAFTANTYFYNNVSTVVFPGQQINPIIYAPQNTKQADFLKSIITKFNIFVDVDKNNPRHFTLEPRDSYYTGGTTLNWTKKLDQSKPISEKLLSELQARRIIFEDKLDKDYFNDYYNQNNNHVYGDFYYTLDNDFVKNDQKITTIFSPTPLVALDASAPDFVISKIVKLDTNNNTYGRTDCNIRLIQKNDGGLLQLQNGKYWKFNTKIFYKIPYAGHLNSPYTDNINTQHDDLNWGQIIEAYWNDPQVNGITDNNSINKFYKNQLDTISDPSSKLVTCQMYLTPTDINQLNFQNQIFIDGITDDGGHYFYLNSVKYSPTQNTTSTVELLKVKNHYVHQYNHVSYRNMNVQAGTISPIAPQLGGSISYANNAIVVGPGNINDTYGDNSIIFGDNNTNNGRYSNIVGSNNYIAAGLSGVTIFGSFLSGTSNDTTYLQNIQVYGTLNGVNISAITNSVSVYVGSIGVGSIVPLSGNNISNGIYGNITGGKNNYIN